MGWQAAVALVAGFGVMLGSEWAGEPPAGGGQGMAADVSKLPPGYLEPRMLPDSLALLPPPPAAGSPGFARDEAISAATALSPESPRWRLAVSDADLHFPHAAATFDCALGVRIDQATTPALYQLLGKAMIDIGLSTYKAKNQYRRVRPFVAHNGATCYPPDEAALRNDGSYPSGHSALGWGWALLLTELAPTRADAILRRGREFGDSRLICNAHWASDVEAGRLVAAATVARLHAGLTFQSDMEKARVELQSAPQPDSAACSAEALALAGS
jgi:acid phosphatase (class A)